MTVPPTGSFTYHEEAATDRGVLHPTRVDRNPVAGMPRRPAAGIHQGRWPTTRSTIDPLLVRTLHHDCAALSTAPMPLKHAQRSLLEGQIDGDVFRYDDVCTPCIMGAVDFSNTGGFPGVLKTLSVMTGNHPVCPCVRGIESGRGNATCKVLLAILYLTEGQQSS
jgi:hypothetical protein